MLLDDNNITIFDPLMGKNEIRLIKSHSEILGFNITNKTGKHLYIGIIWKESDGKYNIDRLIISD